VRVLYGDGRRRRRRRGRRLLGTNIIVRVIIIIIYIYCVSIYINNKRATHENIASGHRFPRVIFHFFHLLLNFFTASARARARI